MIEEWKQIEGFEGLYEVSNLGRVKSLRYRQTNQEKILKPIKTKRGYYHCFLAKEGKQVWYYVHRLVASAFLEKPLDPKMNQVNHKDENPSNNCAENLEWCNSDYNINYGKHNQRVREALQYKPVIQFTKSGEFVKRWDSIADVYRVLGISQGQISQCCNGKKHYKSAGGFVWKFV